MGKIIARMTGLRGMFYGLSMAYAGLISLILLFFPWSGVPATRSEVVLALAIFIAIASTISGVIASEPSWYIAWSASVAGCSAVAYIVQSEVAASANGFNVGRHSILFLVALALVAMPVLSRER